MKRISITAILCSAALPLEMNSALAQGITDLLGRKQESSATPGAVRRGVVVGRDRVDLRLTADVIPSVTGRNRGQAEIGISANLDLDFICGQFDLKGTFRNLLRKEVREEFLEGLLGFVESELTGSAMELLCQAQPTICTLLQNHNIAANLKLGYHYDRCKAIDEAIDHAQKRVYAGAIEQCLREKEAAGVPLAEALDACRRAGRVRGFQGEALAEFDLAKELSKLVGLSDGGQKLLDGLAEETRYGGTWVSSKPDADVLLKRHEEAKRIYVDRWEKAMAKVDRRERVVDEERAELIPPGSPVLAQDELETIGLLPPHARRAAVASLASAAALLHLTREIHEVERALETVAGVPTIEEGQRKMLEGRLARLRKERSRLEELYADQEFFNRSYQNVKGLADEAYYTRIGLQRQRAAIDSRRRGMYAQVAAWGSARRPPSAPPVPQPSQTRSTVSADCGGCGFEYSFGTVGGSR